MAKIYKIEGYIVSPNGDEIDIEDLVERFTDGFPLMYRHHCGCEEFEWDDDLDINQTDDYWVADKLYCRLGYDRVVRELKESRNKHEM